MAYYVVGGGTNDCDDWDIFNCSLVIADSEEEALNKYFETFPEKREQQERIEGIEFGAVLKEPIG